MSDILGLIIDQFTDDVTRAVNHAKFWVDVVESNQSMLNVANAMVAVNKVITVVDDLLIVCRIGQKSIPEFALDAANKAHTEYSQLVAQLYRLAAAKETQ